MTGNDPRRISPRRSPLLPLGALLLACALVSTAAQAQPYIRQIDAFTVERSDGSRYLNPFSGGLVQPRIGLRDINGDGLPDLLTLNPDNRLRYYVNEGGFRFRRQFPSPYDAAPVRSWFRIADIDADGADDLFTAGALSEVLVYRNSGTTAAPVFPAAPDTLRRGDTTIFTQQETVPSLADIDGDGDLDLFSGNIEGSISFYRNIGTAAAPRFTFVTGMFEDILVISSGGVPGKTRSPARQMLERHGASVLDFVDLDRDGDLDILFGDFFTDKLLFFRNTGTPALPSFGMNRLDTAFRPNGDVVSSTGFNQPASGDLDGDGDLDVLVSALYPLAPDQPIVLYENTSGTAPGMPAMRRRAIELTGEIDAGTYSAPAFISDASRNGILVGSSDGSLLYFSIAAENKSTIWRQQGRFPTMQNLFQAVPTAGDLDGDGTAEILIGDANDGRVRLFRFQGNTLVNAQWQLDTFRVNQYAAPQLVDLDRDGDLDLFVGAGNGQFVYFENTGSRTSPLFARAVPPSPFNTLDVGQNSAITFLDIDYDGLPDAIVGGRARPDLASGFIRFYLNRGTSFDTSYRYPDIATDRSPVPAAFRPLEGNHLIIGQQAGGLLAFRDIEHAMAVPDVPATAGTMFSVSPAVLRGGGRLVTIAWNIQNERASLGVIDLLGREVLREELTGRRGTRELSLSDLPAGVYYLAVEGAPGAKIAIIE